MHSKVSNNTFTFTCSKIQDSLNNCQFIHNIKRKRCIIPYEIIHYWKIILKVGLSPSQKIFFSFTSMIALQMIKNVFYFILKALRSQDIKVFVLNFWTNRKNGLIRKIRSIRTSWRHSLVSKELQQLYCSISHELKTTRQ